jgi:RNA polymerase primary sigma factor
MLSDSDALKFYIHNINQYPLLSTEEEKELAARIANGDEEARSRLIRGNLRLVVKIAHDFKNNGLPIQDLIAEGNIGLMRAVDKFDPSKGAKLSSYAAWWIKQAMRRALNLQTRIIRTPTQSALKISKILMSRAKLLNELGREPTDKEIARDTGYTERTVKTLRRMRITTVSMQEPFRPGDDAGLEDIIPDEKCVMPEDFVRDNETLNRLPELLQRLDEREQEIIRLRFGLKGDPPKTLEEVSAAVGRTRERVRQIQNQALTKLKILMETDGNVTLPTDNEDQSTF